MVTDQAQWVSSCRDRSGTRYRLLFIPGDSNHVNEVDITKVTLPLPLTKIKGTSRTPLTCESRGMGYHRCQLVFPKMSVLSAVMPPSVFPRAKIRKRMETPSRL